MECFALVEVIEMGWRMIGEQGAEGQRLRGEERGGIGVGM